MFPRQSQVVGFIREEFDMLQTVTSDATFGPGPTFTTDVGFDIALSPDKKAFTALFSGLEAIIDGKTAPPIVTRVFSFSIPLTDAKPGQEIPFFVSGFAVAEKGANAQLVFSVNDQSSMAYLPTKSDEASSISSNTRLRTRLRPKLPFFFLQTGIRNQTQPSI
jgi:hypothetical protein